MTTPLEIEVTADVSSATTGLKKVQSDLGATAIAAKNAGAVFGDFSKIVADNQAKLGQLVIQTQSASKAFQDYGVKAKSTADYSNTASLSISKLGEQAQKSASKVSELISGLGSQAIGLGLAAGIGVAISALAALGDAIFGATQYQKILSASFEAAGKEIAKAKASVSELTVEVDLAKKGFISKDDVVKKYNDTIGKTTGLVKTVEQVEAALISKGPAYIQLMGLKAIANYAFAKSAETAFQALTLKSGKDAFGLTEKITKDLEAASKQFNDIGVSATKLAGVVTATNGLSFFDDNKIVKEKKGAKTITDVIDTLAEKVSVLRDTREKISAIKSAIVELATKFNLKPDNSIIVQLNKDIDNLIAQLPAKKEKIVRTVADVMKELKIQIDIFNLEELNLKTDKSQAKISALEGALSELFKKFGKTGKSKEVIEIIADIQFIQQKQIIDEFISPKKILSKDLAKKPVDIDMLVKVHPKFITPEIDKELEALQKIIEDATTNALNSVGESLGNTALGNGNLIGNLFSGLLSALGGGLRSFGIQVILASKLVQAAKTALKAGSITGIGAGIALVALGTIISGLASKLQGPKFATGVRNFQPGGFALVGERGPERIFLPSGSSVQPNNELTAYGGGASESLRLEISGTQAVIWLDRIRAQMNRNN